ncbi:hypothetical protein KC19_10G173800 [Ceratodon purpureus]|uniref:Uncharacterized protein n=1 Tax=Ceratodon purpureus TaxID=3225 RepID=A0A8T0GPZ1_CERPU|nr:hypothetical protein KC19_10G173800 [Ceratodon purpureus]
MVVVVGCLWFRSEFQLLFGVVVGDFRLCENVGEVPGAGLFSCKLGGVCVWGWV